MNTVEYDVFCWTKMQAESGEELARIISRKEHERKAGMGVFYWGIGNSLGKKIVALQSRSAPKVLFSKMISPPKLNDYRPKAVCMWLSHFDAAGHKIPLPAHVALTSRAFSASGLKQRHYALVCRSEEPLVLGERGILDLSCFRNYDSDNPRVGSSQVTTVLERHQLHYNKGRSDIRYIVNIVADLVRPYLIVLADPIILGPDELDAFRALSITALDSDNYARLLATFRDDLLSRRSPASPSQLSLFATSD